MKNFQEAQSYIKYAFSMRRMGTLLLFGLFTFAMGTAPAPGPGITSCLGVTPESPAHRTPETPSDKTKHEREQRYEQLSAQLTKAWVMFYSSEAARNPGDAPDYSKAIAQILDIIKSAGNDFGDLSIDANHLLARCQWAAGTRESMEQARRIWKQQEKLDKKPRIKLRLQIVQALELEASNDPIKLGQSLAVLGKLLQDNPDSEILPEAVLELARLNVKTRRFDDAKKVLDSLARLLNKADTVYEMGISPEAAKVYADAVKIALKNLKYAREVGLAQFEAAQKLHKAGQFTQAIQAYKTIIKDFAATDYAPHSEVLIGDCLVSLNQASAAVEQWKKFISIKPAGAWRGQALLGLIDLYLLGEQPNLIEAAKFADIAKASQSAGLADEDAAQSWKDAACDILLRVGMVSYLQNKFEIATKAFEDAKPPVSKKDEKSRL